MKKFNILYVICVLFISFAACKKDSNGGSKYFIKAMIGASEKIFTDSAIAIKGLPYNNIYGINFSAYLSSTYKNGLEFQVAQSDKNITEGTYTQSGSFNSNYSIVAAYRTGTADSSGTFGAFYDKISPTKPLQITISSISDTQVSGTFSGMLYSKDVYHSDSLLISNGSFNLPIQ